MPDNEDHFSRQIIWGLSALNTPSPGLLGKKCNAAKQQQQIRDSKAEEGFGLQQQPQQLLKYSAGMTLGSRTYYSHITEPASRDPAGQVLRVP